MSPCQGRVSKGEESVSILEEGGSQESLRCGHQRNDAPRERKGERVEEPEAVPGGKGSK